VKKGYEAEVKAIFEKWDLHAEVIGEVIDEDRLHIFYEGKEVADVPADSLVLGGGAPVYVREAREPDYLHQTRNFDAMKFPVPNNLNNVLLKLLSSSSIASKHWVYEQYDSMVRTNNTVLDESDAAVVWIKGTQKALSIKTDCNGRYTYLNPRRGGMIAVGETVSDHELFELRESLQA
jgi:phosphoribosylformylglycinamidine synthase subunit PurL